MTSDEERDVTTRTLTAPEIEDAMASLDEDGYAVIRGAIDSAALQDFADHLHGEYDRAGDEGRLFDGGGSLTGHLNCFPGRASRFVYDAIAENGILDIVKARTPDRLDQMRVTTNYNLPASKVQHFHSDGLYTDAFLICNVAVVDTDLENGAIDMIPGTHKRFYKFWRYAIERKFRQSTRIPMQQGDVLLRMSTTWHRGMPNHTDRARPMMSLTFGEASAPEGDPFGVNDGEVLFFPNWYGTDRRAQLQERAFVAMPWLYSTLRFTRSLVGNKGYSSW